MNLQLKMEFDQAGQRVVIHVVDAAAGNAEQGAYGAISISLLDIAKVDLGALIGQVMLQQVGSSPNSPVYMLASPMRMLGSDGNWHAITLREEKVYTTVGGICKQRSKFIFSSETFKGSGDPA